MTPWKHRLLAYVILVVLFSGGLFGLQRFVTGKSLEQISENPALAEIKAVAASNSIPPEVVRSVLGVETPPSYDTDLMQIWTIAQEHDVSKYEASFYLADPAERVKTKGLHVILLSQAITIGFVVGAYGLVYALIGAFAQPRAPAKKGSRRSGRS